MKLEL